MEINEKALRAAADFAEEQGWAVDDNSDGTYRDDVRNLKTFAKIVGAYLDALPASPEGKLRVRACICLGEDGEWFINGSHEYDTLAAFREAARPRHCILEPVYRWIEADVTPWKPPAEETAQGREVVTGPGRYHPNPMAGKETGR